MQKVRVENNDVFYIRNGSGTTIVFLHGYPQSHYCWRDQIEFFSEQYDVIAPDWIGWGQSEKKLGIDLSYWAEVKRFENFILQMKIEGGFHLVAHDYGAFLSLGLFQKNELNILSLTLSNSRCHKTFLPSYKRLVDFQVFLSGLTWLRKLVSYLPWYSLHRNVLKKYIDLGSFDDFELERYIGWIKRSQADRLWMIEYYAAYRTSPPLDINNCLNNISCPIQVIWGEGDEFLPREIALDINKRKPEASLEFIEDGGHYVMETKPDEFNQILKNFITQVELKT